MVFITLLIIVFLCACQSMSSDETSTPSSFSYVWEDRSIFREGLTAGYFDVLDGLPGATVYHINLEIDPSMTSLRGVEEVYYTNHSTDATLTELEMRLYANILGGSCTVSSAMVNGASITPSYSLENSLMTLPLNIPLAPGASTVIRLEFEDTIPIEMETNYGILVYYGNTLALAHFYPMMAVFEENSWKADVPPQQGDILFNETSFYIVTVSAPSDLVLVASGRKVDEVKVKKSQRVIFAAGPARDFYLAASPEFSKISQQKGDITINSYAPSGSRDGSQLALDSTSAALEEFDRIYASYPYSELDIVAVPTLALGIEYPGLIAMNQDIYDLSASSNGTPLSIILESSVVHEVVHQWFYNLVGNDQVNEPWLDESLAQYATWHYYIDRYGSSSGQGFESSLQSRWDRVNGENIPIGLPVSDYQDREYSAIIYGRGAFFFEALDQAMGQPAFDTFMSDYTKTYSWGISNSSEFKSLAERDCSCDLTSLFQEWVYPP
jgi:hypothetical protein